MEKHRDREKLTTVDLSESHNPYHNDNLIETQSEPETMEPGVEPFNSAVGFENLVSGRRKNQRLSEYSDRKRRAVKFWAITAVVLAVLALFWDVFVH